MKKLLLFGSILVLILSSCGKNSAEYKALKAQNDSLLVANAQQAAEVDEIVSLMNEVEDNFSSIRSAENYLNVQSNAPGELAQSAKDRVRADMQFVMETLSKNKEKIAELEKKLSSSVLQSKQLQQTLNNLRAQLDEKTAALVALNQELERKDQKIAELSDNLTALSRDVQDLKTYASAQEEMISAQTRELNTVYYRFGTSKELKNEGLLKDGQLGANFNKEGFIRVRDLNTLEVVPLYAKSGKLVSKHPSGSYEFAKTANGQVELRILDPKNFWSLTKYLVVQVDM
jgi:predicted  nucleic acid-binding Zn-ribbon protein